MSQGVLSPGTWLTPAKIYRASASGTVKTDSPASRYFSACSQNRFLDTPIDRDGRTKLSFRSTEAVVPAAKKMRGIAKSLAQSDCYFGRPSCRNGPLDYRSQHLHVRRNGRTKAALCDDAVAGVLGEVLECGCPSRANGLWVTLFTWNFVTPEAAQCRRPTRLLLSTELSTSLSGGPRAS